MSMHFCPAETQVYWQMASVVKLLNRVREIIFNLVLYHILYSIKAFNYKPLLEALLVQFDEIGRVIFFHHRRP